jgi:predicted nucleic acid-binding protein
MGGPRGTRLLELLRNSRSIHEVATTIISVQENMQGWIDQIRRQGTNVQKHIEYYKKMQDLLRDYQHILVLPFDASAYEKYKLLKSLSVPLKDRDMKIAAITLATPDAILLSRDTDFEQVNHKVADFRVEDWLADDPD